MFGLFFTFPAKFWPGRPVHCIFGSRKPWSKIWPKNLVNKNYWTFPTLSPRTKFSDVKHQNQPIPTLKHDEHTVHEKQSWNTTEETPTSVPACSCTCICELRWVLTTIDVPLHPTRWIAVLLIIYKTRLKAITMEAKRMYRKRIKSFWA